MINLEDAIALAVALYRGQVDKAGQPYIIHHLKVMLAMDTEVEKMIAVLHDVVEDTGLELEDLRRMGYPTEVLEVLSELTKADGEAYEGFISRIKTHPLARKIKIADLRDNIARTSQRVVTPRRKARMKKYQEALSYLETKGKVGPVDHDLPFSVGGSPIDKKFPVEKRQEGGITIKLYESIRESKTGTSCYTDARVTKESVVVSQYDVGHAPKQFFGHDDYEREITVPYEERDKLILLLIRELFGGRIDGARMFQDFLKENSVEYGIFTWP